MTHIFALEFQIAAIGSALRTPDAFASLQKHFPEITRVFEASTALRLSRPMIQESVVRMYSEYVAEWVAFRETVAWPKVIHLTTTAHDRSTVAG
jgi:hypothetical protein